MKVNELDKRMCLAIVKGREFTADDVTLDGLVTADPTHTANARQNSIGSLFNSYSAKKWIRHTGQSKKSTAPHRKGGRVQIWEPTEFGIDAALERLEEVYGV